ncbi:YlbG family protein [Paraliobacillus sp. JSM ZJ581]|uniref:YlbG family protein n=1 Tax=Paraliobacillus sp. JSM ZJ581 TaxID=3342118 RepID=UPI0035A86B8F
MRTNRQGLVIWFQHMKNVKQIKRYGHLIYVSKNLKYAVIYVDQDEVNDKSIKLERLPFVSKVDQSAKPFVKTEFENAQKDKAKEYDYKMGI